MKYSIAIMAGGQSRRFGEDKTLFLLNGKPLIRYVIDSCIDFTDDLFVVTKNKEKFNSIIDIPIFLDEFDIQCPLSGVITALNNAKYEKIIILPSDSPFFNPKICDIFLDNLSDDYDMVFPKINNKTYVLTGMYRRYLKEIFKKKLLENEYKIIKIIEDLKVKYLYEDYFKRLDSELISFLNINRFEDVKKAENFLKGEK